MTIEKLKEVVNHPATHLGMAILMMTASYVHAPMHETVIYNIPARSLISLLAQISLARAAYGYTARFFPNEINLPFHDMTHEYINRITNSYLTV